MFGGYVMVIYDPIFDKLPCTGLWLDFLWKAVSVDGNPGDMKLLSGCVRSLHNDEIYISLDKSYYSSFVQQINEKLFLMSSGCLYKMAKKYEGDEYALMDALMDYVGINIDQTALDAILFGELNE